MGEHITDGIQVSEFVRLVICTMSRSDGDCAAPPPSGQARPRTQKSLRAEGTQAPAAGLGGGLPAAAPCHGGTVSAPPGAHRHGAAVGPSDGIQVC